MAIRNGRIFVCCFLHTSAQSLYFSQLPPHDTGNGVKTVTLGWVGAPLTSALRSEFMTQSLVLPIDVCQGFGISPLQPKHPPEFFFLKPILAQRRFQICFFRALPKVWNFFFFLNVPIGSVLLPFLGGYLEKFKHLIDISPSHWHRSERAKIDENNYSRIQHPPHPINSSIYRMTKTDDGPGARTYR